MAIIACQKQLKGLEFSLFSPLFLSGFWFGLFGRGVILASSSNFFLVIEFILLDFFSYKLTHICCNKLNNTNISKRKKKLSPSSPSISSRVTSVNNAVCSLRAFGHFKPKLTNIHTCTFSYFSQTFFIILYLAFFFFNLTVRFMDFFFVQWV